MNKIVSIQMLRGVAASMVCMFHFTAGSPDYMAQIPALKEIANYGSYGVQIFFVISGFVLPYSLYNAGYQPSSFGNFLLRRVVRIDPPYLANIVVVIALAYVSTLSPVYRGKGVDYNWSDMALHLGYLNSFFNRPWINPVYWTLGIEFQFYILLGLIFGVFSKSSNIVRAIVVAAFLALAILVPQHSLIFVHTPLFLMGIFTFFFFEKFITVQMLIATIALFSAVGCLNGDWVGTILGLSTVTAIIFWNSPSRLWLFLGTISYSLYLLHIPFGTRVTNFIEGRSDNVYLRLMFIPIAFAFSVAVAWVFYNVVEKKSIEWSKSIKSKSIKLETRASDA
jgi:peptidoglycan/LPS O-acetylase OafA/YrhL